MKKKPMPVSGRTENSLKIQAQSQLNAGKYKDAIELYKKLLQEGDNAEWRRQLAFCYLQRAKAFAVKGMIKEALVMWENYRGHALPPYESYDLYLAWLILTGSFARIRPSLELLTTQQLDKDYPDLAAVLGLLILTEHPEFQQSLPQDSNFIAHLRFAQTALQSYRDKDPDGMDQGLKKLPFRSAFRDFRTLLKASAAFPASLTETQSLLSKIPANSPYSQAARLLFACTLKGSALVYEMLKFNPPERRLIGDMIGLNKKQLEFVESLSKHKAPFSDKTKFNLVLQFQSHFGAESARRFCFATLTAYPAGRRDYGKAFGPIDAVEENRLKALTSEHENNDYDAEYFWTQCINALAEKRPDNDLKIALIFRHIAKKQPEQERIVSLIESLAYDPDDKDSYLQILKHYGQYPDTAENYKQWLDKTIGKFPQDTEVLILAVQAATHGKAYKKAIQYASKILQIDPLNTFAKQVIFSSRLAHARRLIKNKKLHLVESELQQADILKLGKHHTLQIQLMKGLLRFASDDKQLGLLEIAEALDKLNQDPVTAHFQAAVEALLTGLPVATLLRELSEAKDHLLSAQELTRLIRLIMQYNREEMNQEVLHKALEKVKTPLKQAVLKQNFDENLLLTLCQALDTIQHFELLRHCSKWAQAKWHNAIWTYYRVYSETNGDPEKITYMHHFRLLGGLDQAVQEKDQRVRVLIERYLERYRQAHSSTGLDFFEDFLHPEPEQPAEYADPLDQLFGHLPDEVFRTIDKKADALVKKTSPERLVQQLSEFTGTNSNLFLAMMQNPDLFTALMLIKAAGELGIEIGVAVDDVLNYFNVDKTPRSLPFPF